MPREEAATAPPAKPPSPRPPPTSLPASLLRGVEALLRTPGAPGRGGVAAPVPAEELPPRARYQQRRRVRATIYGDLVVASDASTGAAVVAKRSMRRLVDAGTSRRGTRVREDPLEEARLLRELPRHRNLVRYVAEHEDFVAEEGPRHWLVLARVDGPDLFDVVDATAGLGLPPRRVRRLFLGVVRAVHHLHAHRVAHLDVSLENVLVSRGAGDAVLCDLGLARELPAGAARVRTGGPPPTGKEMYMAPELYRGEAFVDPLAADVWSLGVLLFAMLAAAPPFEAPSPGDAGYELVRAGRLAALVRELDAEQCFTPAVLGLLSRMLSEEPALRPTTSEVLADPAWASCGGADEEDEEDEVLVV